MSIKTRTLLPLVNSEDELEALQKRLPKSGPRGGMVVWEEGRRFVKIPLTQGKHALISLEDYEQIGRFRWCAHNKPNGWYVCRRENGQMIPMHRQIMGFPKLEIDHKNHNGLDNRRENLRYATRSQNCWNSRLRKNNTSGYMGVYFCQSMNKWTARITCRRKVTVLGYFTDPIAASNAYMAAAVNRDREFTPQVHTTGNEGTIVMIERL